MLEHTFPQDKKRTPVLILLSNPVLRGRVSGKRCFLFLHTVKIRSTGLIILSHLRKRKLCWPLKMRLLRAGWTILKTCFFKVICSPLLFWKKKKTTTTTTTKTIIFGSPFTRNQFDMYSFVSQSWCAYWQKNDMLLKWSIVKSTSEPKPQRKAYHLKDTSLLCNF